MKKEQQQQLKSHLKVAFLNTQSFNVRIPHKRLDSIIIKTIHLKFIYSC